MPCPSSRFRVATLACALAAASIWAGDAPANTGTDGSATMETTASTRAPSSGLNLLSGPRPGKPAVRVRTMGSGSWVCSPAGFGQRSRCYRN